MQAFPTYESDRGGHLYCTDAGMTLRDYFAAKALNGFLAQFQGVANGCDPADHAKFAYECADAMLAARKEAA